MQYHTGRSEGCQIFRVLVERPNLHQLKAINNVKPDFGQPKIEKKTLFRSQQEYIHYTFEI